MKVVWKYPISMFAGPTSMPRGARIIHAGLDPRQALCVWVEVDPSQPEELRRIKIIGTGAFEVPEGYSHVGSAVQGEYVWHVYAEDRP